MSVADAERFVDEVAKDKQLAERLKPHAAGLAALAAGAKTHGYDFTVDELKQALRAKARQDLDDAQLDAIAGGSGGQPQLATAVAVTGANVVVQLNAIAQIGNVAVLQAVAQVNAIAMG